MLCAGVGQPACIHQVVTASLAGPSSCPRSENELTRWHCVVLGSLQVGQDISHILWNLKVHYRVHSGLTFAPVLGQISPIRAPIPRL
jgi:hypothetical protein